MRQSLKAAIAAGVLACLAPVSTTEADVIYKCPESFNYNIPKTRVRTCFCTTAMMRKGEVWGTSAYTVDSAVCRAAQHAGLVPSKGGLIGVTGADGQSSYKGSDQNGIQSKDRGAQPWSFKIVRGRRPRPPQPRK